MKATFHSRFRAMGTFFEIFLAGDDQEHLEAVAGAAWEEVTRLERLLSRFHGASEISRLNRAAGAALLVDVEVWEILCACHTAWRETAGYFDITAASRIAALRLDGKDRHLFDDENGPLLLDESRRAVQLSDARLSIDLGGFAKGYALDCAKAILLQNGIDRALMHGGASSVLAVGSQLTDDDPTKRAVAGWPVDLRDPFSAALEEGESLLDGEPILLCDQALSCSATLALGQKTSDVIDVRAGVPLAGRAACVAIAPTGAEAEVISTACLAMGKSRAANYIKNLTGAKPAGDRRLGWLEPSAAGQTRVDWLA